MFLLDPLLPGAPRDLIFTASDLVVAAQCEYELLRKLDEKLGRSPKAEFPPDEMLARTAELGDVHEHRVLQGFRDTFGAGVVEIAGIADYTRPLLEAKHRESIAALRSGADVVFQASFFDGSFHGRSDFLVREGDGSSARYAVYDSKLARHAKVTALLQLAAYGDQLIKAGIDPSPTVTLVLGDRSRSDHSLRDLLPVFRERRRRFLELTSAHRAQRAPVAWGDDRHTACGRCDYCAEQVALHRDVLLVSRMSPVRRRRLRDLGVTTIDQLAAMELPPGEAPDGVLARLRDQARMQTGMEEPDGAVQYTDGDGTRHSLAYRVLAANALGTLPAPSEGDIFFDFEGDPLWQDQAGTWGLEYLFGVMENPPAPGAAPPFLPFWAHSRAEEGKALAEFLDYVGRRRKQYPDLHIYHYANYEKAALRRLSLQHVIGEDAVDALLREGVLIDLYDVVRNSLRISEKSYSIKKLEPLYMGSHLRSGDVKDAGGSVVAYALYCEARDSGRPQEAEAILASIRDYNEYDCLSTLRLRDWLLERADERGIARARAAEAGPGPESEDPSPDEARLLRHVAAATERALHAGGELTPDEQAVAMVAASVGYHRREDKQFWWGHYDRLNAPLADWWESRDIFTVESGEVLQDWAKPTARSNPVRRLRLTGRLAPGSTIKEGTTVCRVYDPPAPAHLDGQDNGVNYRTYCFRSEVLGLDAEDGKDILLLLDRLPKGAEEYQDFPLALTPDPPPGTKPLRDALAALAAEVGRNLRQLPPQPALDLLRRLPPRLGTLPELPAVGAGPDAYIEAILAAVEDLDRSYLAVQGPPGSGKTHVGAHVIGRLVERGWKVGVVAQSHAVVEHMMTAAVDKGGVPADRVAKKSSGNPVPWSQATDADVARLLDGPGGALVGGTAWTMTGNSVPAGALDLLVIDEAGQFSLANTLAVSRACRRMLLLGDPQQLPQVSQGTHPEPVDESALGWLSAGHATLPSDLGYFLARSWRMHPELCRAVSGLSYEGRLASAPAAVGRLLEGAPPGVECVLVQHEGNATSSPEEAAEVVRQVGSHLGLQWSDPQHGPAPRPLTQEDLLVVAPYNAQVQLVRHSLEAAGYPDVRVGTVDKFQGREAPVVIVSTTVSDVSQAPRGMEFVLNRNRMNVAVSRGQWRAVIIRSTALTAYFPARPHGLEELGAFIGLCECNPSQSSTTCRTIGA
ncbi:TM0106 family RecB-like putative nuclease [Arthrobacter sp. USHLN218]|uniref:TM0106 family RecB-like putative nuclease n=1 Tax=Arthrobacter sp. USHLN218 TaxID=3081232 RepID=UPI003017E327